jgi:hypothetical protein
MVTDGTSKNRFCKKAEIVGDMHVLLLGMYTVVTLLNPTGGIRLHMNERKIIQILNFTSLFVNRIVLSLTSDGY